MAFRSLPRPSSLADAKASTVRPWSLNHRIARRSNPPTMSEKLDTPAILAFVCRRTAPGLSGENARPPVWLCMLRLVIPRRINLRSHRTESLQTDANSTAKKIGSAQCSCVYHPLHLSKIFARIRCWRLFDICSIGIQTGPLQRPTSPRRHWVKHNFRFYEPHCEAFDRSGSGYGRRHFPFRVPSRRVSV